MFCSRVCIAIIRFDIGNGTMEGPGEWFPSPTDAVLPTSSGVTAAAALEREEDGVVFLIGGLDSDDRVW